MLLFLVLVLGGGTILVKLSDSLFGSLALGRSDVPPCSAAMNRWANQRVTAARSRLQATHSRYRTEGLEFNVLTGAMNWIDDRFIDQQINALRSRVSRDVRRSARCNPKIVE